MRLNCFLGKALTEVSGNSGRIAIFEANIMAAFTGCFMKTSINIQSRMLMLFYYIQISCWVYRPELQWQFRLFCTRM